jgi:2-(1,2-epoxy-1,2-dihydrophenyl)acetyl-CoA isomerase
VPDCGGTWLLPRVAGRARAMGLALLGDKLSAEQAQAWGMIWQVVDDEQLSVPRSRWRCTLRRSRPLAWG